MHHLVAFQKRSDLKQKYGSNAHMLWALGLYLDESDLDALASRSLTDGSNDKCIDFIEIDKTGQKIVIAQGYFSEKEADKAPAKKASDLNTAISWLAHGNIESKTMNDKVKARAIEFRKLINEEEIEHIEILYIHNRPESINSQEELDTCAKTASTIFSKNEISVSCKEVGLKEIERIYRENASQIVIDKRIKINGKKLGSHHTEDWDSHIFTVKGSWLRDLFREHEDNLFSANYRGFLGISKRKKINSSIKSTAEKQPSDFWVFNNGITLLTHELISGNKGENDYLRGISIINGAQTTGSLGSIDEKFPLNDVSVMCRIVVCKNPSKINEIVKYNNTQNKITTWDQYANDEIQTLLHRQFHELGIEYSMKRGFYSSDAAIGIEKSAQPILSFNGFYVDANRSKNTIFERGEIYKRAFNEKTASHILLAYCFSKSIDNVKRSLSEKKTKTAAETQQLAYFNFLSFKAFLASAIGASLSEFIGGSFHPSEAKINKSYKGLNIEEISKDMEKITRQVLRAVVMTLGEKSETEMSTIPNLLTNENTLNELLPRIKTLLSMTIDGQYEESHMEMIFVEK